MILLNKEHCHGPNKSRWYYSFLIKKNHWSQLKINMSIRNQTIFYFSLIFTFRNTYGSSLNAFSVLKRVEYCHQGLQVPSLSFAIRIWASHGPIMNFTEGSYREGAKGILCKGADTHRVGTKILPKQEHDVSTTLLCNEETLWVLPPVQELNSMVLMDPFQLSMFCDSATDPIILFHSLLNWASGATSPWTKQFAFNQFSGQPYGLPGALLKKIEL